MNTKCPNCGYCPHCGRSAQPYYQPVPWYVQPWYGQPNTVPLTPTGTQPYIHWTTNVASGANQIPSQTFQTGNS